MKHPAGETVRFYNETCDKVRFLPGDLPTMNHDLYYHTCGYPIIFQVEIEGSHTKAVLRDGGQEDYAVEPEVIETCPGCGEMLLMGDLIPEPDEE